MPRKNRPETSADRCQECALARFKRDRCNAASDGEFLDFAEAVETETPFWCHAGGDRKQHYAKQVCRGWLAIMERKWRKEGWDVEHPRNSTPGPAIGHVIKIYGC